jgi:hypothetical protein
VKGGYATFCSKEIKSHDLVIDRLCFSSPHPLVCADHFLCSRNWHKYRVVSSETFWLLHTYVCGVLSGKHYIKFSQLLQPTKSPPLRQKFWESWDDFLLNIIYVEIKMVFFLYKCQTAENCPCSKTWYSDSVKQKQPPSSAIKAHKSRHALETRSAYILMHKGRILSHGTADNCR